MAKLNPARNHCCFSRTLCFLERFTKSVVELDQLYSLTGASHESPELDTEEVLDVEASNTEEAQELVNEAQTPATVSSNKRKLTDEADNASNHAGNNSKKPKPENQDEDGVSNKTMKPSESSTAFSMARWCAPGAPFGHLVQCPPNQWMHSMVPLMFPGAYGQFRPQFSRSLVAARRSEST